MACLLPHLEALCAPARQGAASWGAGCLSTGDPQHMEMGEQAALDPRF